MSKFKKVLSLFLVVTMTAALAISGTLAYLTMDSGDEKNVFSIGNINVSLDEEVGVYGEGGEVEKTEDGAEYTDIMPGDYLKKEVTVTNNGKTDAYVAVTVTINNAKEINNAIDDVYGDDKAQAMYDFIFDGWGLNHSKVDAEGNSLGMRLTITGDDMPEHALQVDSVKTIDEYTLVYSQNWWENKSTPTTKGEFTGYYSNNMDTYELCYTYYLYLPAGESSTLFNGLNVPAEFTNEQMKMFDKLEINVEAKAIQADNMTIADQYKNVANGKAKTAFAILAGDITNENIPETSNKPSGTTSIVGYTSANTIWGENGSNAKVSHVIKVYSGDTYLGETSLKQESGYIDGDVYVTWHMPLSGEMDCWDVTWVQKPTLELQPTRIELWVDGELVGQGSVQLSGPDNLNRIGGAVINSDGEILRYVVKGQEANVKDGETYVPFISTADELTAALTGTDKNISVILLNDIDLPISSLGSQTSGSGEYKLGGADTENITINLNGHELNITTGYWSAIGAKNDGATITILNGSMTSTGNSATTWNANDIRLCNCNYVIENVTFNKEVALDNAGKTTTMKNVTINGTGDYYALWITAEGQNVTIDGLTVNTTGRGIKIDEQYVENPAKVTLSVSNSTFTTAKKAAIMVKSTAGANITVSDIDITGVAADTTNAVWVDSDASQYAGLVTVTGGSVINEE